MSTQFENITLKIVKYNLDISKEADRKTYEKITEKCLSLGHKLFDCISSNQTEYVRKIPESVTIETEFLFENQYNTKEGLRIHDWYEPIYQNRNMKYGYYIDNENLSLLKEAKENQLSCGYCGKRYWKNETKIHFCNSCLGSKYLTEKELPLLLLKPVSFKGTRKDKIPETLLEEFNALKPVKEKLRLERLKKEADQNDRETAHKIKKLQYESDMKSALLRHGFSDENLIYYSHSKSWVLGWRNSVNDDEFNKFKNEVASLDLPLDLDGIHFVNILHQNKGP